MDFQYYYEKIIFLIMDSLEEFVEGFTFVGGKRLRETFFVTLGFLAVTVAIELLGLQVFTFVSWQEAAVAAGIMFLIQVVDIINEKGVDSIVNKFFRGRNSDDQR